MTYTAKDFAKDTEVRWCPGCGDHAILKHLQSAMAKSGAAPHNTAIISGIGCASRLPYYMNTFGFHTIHGRALPIATGLKLTRPEMDVWVVTGDGDALSIGGNHFIHLFRRDVDLNILLFNNEVYGLTKGQYSPTSKTGQISKTSPRGSKETPIHALKLALASGTSFVARTLDRDSSHIQEIFIHAKEHHGSSLVEILQNCPIFNDGVFGRYTEKGNQAENTLRLRHGQPLIFGNENEWAIVLEGFDPRIVPVSQINEANKWIHDEKDRRRAELLSEFGYNAMTNYPLALGILYRNPREKITQVFDNYEIMLKDILHKGKLEFY